MANFMHIYHHFLLLLHYRNFSILQFYNTCPLDDPPPKLRYLIIKISIHLPDHPGVRLKQATLCSGLSSRNSGSSLEHWSVAIGQRGWNRQPNGGFNGLGTSPCNIILSRFSFGFGIGMADISALV